MTYDDQNAVVLWTMHPWERDARLMKEALVKGPQAYAVIIEVASTRSSEQLLGARRAYHSLFDHSIEEDVAYHINDSCRKVSIFFLFTKIMMGWATKLHCQSSYGS